MSHLFSPPPVTTASQACRMHRLSLVIFGCFRLTSAVFDRVLWSKSVSTATTWLQTTLFGRRPEEDFPGLLLQLCWTHSSRDR
ncbi:hypothetical protein B0H14DRAFT_2733560 [Mycena olivaceomarginata]|nr:hypothetical protein B0H14DRAFT_2733560 [Mycena olivaceomarginata]